MDSLVRESYWLQDAPEPHLFPALDADIHVDVAVIGAGITGLTAALHLKQAGKQVAVLEAGRVGGGTTGGTSGHLDVLPDQGLAKLAAASGESNAQQVIAARAQAIDAIDGWAQKYDIKCDFRRLSGWKYTECSNRIEQIQEEYELARRLGMDVTMHRRAGLPFTTAAAMEIRNQARFHAVKYLHGLVRVFHDDRSVIYENTQAQPPEDGSPCQLEANGRRVTATDVVLATHSSYLGVSQFDLRQAAYQSYVMAARVHDHVPDALFWDDAQPYHYIRRATSDDPRLLIIGGADHKTGQGDVQEQSQRLHEFVAQRFHVMQIERQWSAELFEPSDGLPFIGRVPATDHLFIATGFSGTGLTYGTLAGRILADLILGRDSPHAELFSPSRLKLLAAAKDFVLENLNAVKHFVVDRFAADDVKSLDDVRPGEGRLVRLEGETLAVYRDEQNQLHQFSPACTHAGCYVQWNSIEKTWDCPCHGGRFSATGKRIYGPPTADLEQKSAQSAGRT